MGTSPKKSPGRNTPCYQITVYVDELEPVAQKVSGLFKIWVIDVRLIEAHLHSSRTGKRRYVAAIYQPNGPIYRYGNGLQPNKA